MKHFVASILIVVALAACADDTPDAGGGSYYGTTSNDLGPYFMVPTGGLAATAYWGRNYYNPQPQW